MPQILVWKCEHDGKLFEDRALYQAHLRKLARTRAQARKVAKIAKQREDFLTAMGAQVYSFDELTQFIKDNWQWFFLNGLLDRAWQYLQRPTYHDHHELVEIAFTNMQWNSVVSNSHSAPRTGVTNWDRKGKLHDGTAAPLGYPGWHGRVRFKVRTPKRKKYYLDSFGSGYFARTPICLGSGSGGRDNDDWGLTTYEAEVKLFADDWPALAKGKTWEILSA